MLLFCYNLEPSIRHTKWNVIVVGLVPGPKASKRLDTFMLPIIKEFKKLGGGIRMWHEHLQMEILVKSDLTTLISDMKACEGMIRTLGNRAKSKYREFCEIIELAKSAYGKGTVYCPLHQPELNMPPVVYAREECMRLDGSLAFGFDNVDTCHNVHIRTDDLFRNVATAVEDEGPGSKQLPCLYGIGGRKKFMDVEAMLFPWYTTMDYTHLVPMNRSQPKDGVAGEHQQHVQLGAGNDDTVGRPCFNDTGKPQDFPTQFGPFINFGNETSEKGNLTAHSWETWSYKMAPVYLRTVIEEAYFEETYGDSYLDSGSLPVMKYHEKMLETSRDF
ncbi:hypothetical protein BJ508DRAFT_303085 [Ascobolus immersus RN42]|uniref:Uncharacterized protein n=1 Tax=Ascobolus immersus RN42 TaxID=1160509 RepID=A0A3N4IHY0_ASCIM|nr:hypothetical protein BJ508DRAFT_303085 [Ascobolus immersus RN42]